MEKSIHLAIASVPFQKWNEIYGEEEAFEKGTIFPELDKPIFFVEQDQKQMTEHVKKSRAASQEREMLGTIQQTSFVLDDLRLYLDTHPEDKEAFELLQSTIRLSNEGRERYVKRFGPITVRDLEHCNQYAWLQDTWPWDYKGKDR